MLPEDVERYGYGNESIFLNLEQRIMEDVVRRIKNAGSITRSADHQLERLHAMGYSSEEIKKMMKETMRASESYINGIFETAVNTDYISDKDLYKKAGKRFIPYTENTWVQQLVKNVRDQTLGEMENITRSMGFVLNGKTGQRFLWLSEFYKETLDQAMADIITGSFDYNTTLRKTVKQMTNSGIRFIDYETGHHNRVVVASRRSMMTGLTQLSSQMSQYNAQQLGSDHFEVAWHANARPSHREWQGKVWTKEELGSVCGLGTVEGLCGANCYHVYYPFIVGISKRNWSDEWLEEQNKREDEPHSFNGKKYTAYEATQRQRTLETRMRAQRESIKLLKEGECDPQDIMFEQAKYRATMNEYVKFSKKMNLRQQKERIYVDGLEKQGSGARNLANIDIKKAMTKQLELLTDQETVIIKKMTGSLSQKINYAISHNLPLKKYSKEMELLDSALSKGHITKGITVIRKTVPEFILNKRNVKDEDMLNLIGEQIKNKIYTSTSLIDFEYPLRNVIMHIEVPKDYRGALYVRELAYDKFKSQEEILFKRNLVYLVQNVEKKGDNFIMKVRLIA